MSINATVDFIACSEDGSGFMELTGDEPGQNRLWFDSAPHDVTALNGLQVWGGANDLLHGETVIAKRIGYTTIEFVVEALGPVVAAEKKRREAR